MSKVFCNYYSQDCLLWVLLPFASDEMISNAAKLMGRFTGDPSFINEYKYIRKTGDGETMQEESVTVRSLLIYSNSDECVFTA